MFRSIACAIALTLGLSQAGCYYRGGAGLLGAIAFTAIATSAIISAQRPPRPYVVYAPAPRRGYTWQPGYWTVVDGDWEWVEGRWIRNYPGYRWSPAHWVEDPSGRWRLMPGRWIAMRGPPVVAPPSTPPPMEDGESEEDEVAPPGEPLVAPAQSSEATDGGTLVK